ncbi:MAG: hypothetical protein J7L61_01655, partial [Thermoplasmata archaeon]|nr:hypothetical protein [Thermoplasmata archaeon]
MAEGEHVICPVCGSAVDVETGVCPRCGMRREGDDMEDRETTVRLFMLLPGVGRKKAEALYDAGFRTIADLREADLSTLAGARGIGAKLARSIQQHIEEGGMEKHGLYLCPECGAFVAEDAMVCHNCGADLSGGEEELAGE